MTLPTVELLIARILVLDDEHQIHASLRLRLGKQYDLVFCYNAADALAALGCERFDLCIVDIHMPKMDGLTFIEAARKSDPGLGYIVLSAFDTDDNLRRTIPLQVYDFISKPLPEREGFEHRIPDWIDRTRRRRHDNSLAEQAGAIAGDLDSALVEREVELVASETARDALLQTASLLTTIHAHLVTATSQLALRAKADMTLTHLLRNLDEAKKTADAAIMVAEGFFDSAYGNRDSSPSYLNAGLRHAINIARRVSRAEETNIAVDFSPVDDGPTLRGLSGIEFLLMMVPAIAVALASAGSKSTVRVDSEPLARLDSAFKEPRLKNYLWLNRKHAITSQPGVLVTVASSGKSFSRSEAEAWLHKGKTPLALVTARGLVTGIQKSKGLLGLALSPQTEHFHLVLALPT